MMRPVEIPQIKIMMKSCIILLKVMYIIASGTITVMILMMIAIPLIIM